MKPPEPFVHQEVRMCLRMDATYCRWKGEAERIWALVMPLTLAQSRPVPHAFQLQGLRRFFSALASQCGLLFILISLVMCNQNNQPHLFILPCLDSFSKGSLSCCFRLSSVRSGAMRMRREAKLKEPGNETLIALLLLLLQYHGSGPRSPVNPELPVTSF